MTCAGVCACCHVKHWRVTLGRFCGRHLRGGFSSFHQQNEERVLHQMRSVEKLNIIVAVLKRSLPPSLRVASAFPIPVAAWRDVNDPGPRRAAVPGQTVHQGEWQMPGQKARFHFADLGWTSAHCSFNTKTCNTLNNKSGDLKLFPEQIYSSDYFTYIQLF